MQDIAKMKLPHLLQGYTPSGFHSRAKQMTMHPCTYAHKTHKLAYAPTGFHPGQPAARE